MDTTISGSSIIYIDGKIYSEYIGNVDIITNATYSGDIELTPVNVYINGEYADLNISGEFNGSYIENNITYSISGPISETLSGIGSINGFLSGYVTGNVDSTISGSILCIWYIRWYIFR
jgi:hypothetical protein